MEGCYQLYVNALAEAQKHASAAGAALREAADCCYVAEGDLRQCDEAVALLVAITDRLLGRGQ